MNSLLAKLMSSSTIKDSNVLTDSVFFHEKDMITTKVAAVNIALSGTQYGGLTPGLTMFAGPSKHFKTGLTLLCAKAYLDKYEDAILLFYDSEFGTPQSYFESFGIDLDRVLHTPITDIEQLKFDCMNQLENIKRGDHVFIAIDSIGNLASKKEVEDAMSQKSVADMTRAKQMKSLFRMVTPHLTIKNIPMVVVNHTYKTQEMFSKDVVSGGTGSYYSSNNIYIIGRQQEKDGKDVVGYNFIINVEKSRYVKEKSKIPLNITWEEGINKWSGMLPIALEGEFVVKPKNGWYARVNMETGEIEDKSWREAATNCKEFWDPILKSEKFDAYITDKYRISTNQIIADDEVEEFLDGVEDTE